MTDLAKHFAARSATLLSEPARAELHALLARHGLACTALECLSPPAAGRKRGRSTLLVETHAGAVMKVRCLESVEEATRLAALHDSVDLPFLPHVQQHGSLLAQSWIAGKTLTPMQANARAEDLGALLGRLHAARPSGAPPRVTTQERTARARNDLDQLVAAGQLARDASLTLRAALTRDDPGSAPAVLVHHDFCPENLVVDPNGTLHLIDNEWLDIDAAGADLGRTSERWTVRENTWRRFLRGYATTAPHEPEALRFWRIAITARSAMIRIEAPAHARRPALALLHELAEAGIHA